MYLLDKRIVRMHPLATMANGDYDKATYEWTIHTVIKYKLINTSDYKSESYRMSGNGNCSLPKRK
jgi:hypothetical protein